MLLRLFVLQLVHLMDTLTVVTARYRLKQLSSISMCVEISVDTHRDRVRRFSNGAEH